MGKVAGGLLRTFSTFLYFLEFLCSAVALGIFSYFLAKLAANDLGIKQRWRAVEGISGAGVLYTIFAILLTCFLGGKKFFGLLAVILNLLFCGAFIAVAVLCRNGASSCSGVVNTPLGVSPGNLQIGGLRNRTACKLNTAVFAVAVAAAVLFLLSAIFQIMLMRHHQKESKYGPSPSNNYTAGSGNRKFWKKKPKTTKDAYGNGESELGTVPVAATNGNTYATTAEPVAQTNGDHYGSLNTKYEAAHGGLGTVHPGPGPTAELSGNPYGYNNTNSAVNY